MKNKEKTALRGSLTVEAALVTGLVVFAVFSLIGMSLWLRDRCSASAEIRLRIEAERPLPGLQRRPGAAEKYLIASGSAEAAVTEEGGSGRFSGNGGRLWPGILLRTDLRAERTFCAPVAFLRRMHLIEHLTEE